MRGLLSVMALVIACAPHPSEGEPVAVETYPFHAPPVGAIGRPGDDPIEWSASGQWIAVCRPTPAGPVPRLLVGDDLELDMNRLHATDPVGRWLVIDRAGERILYDAVLRREHALGRVATTTWGSFDARGTKFAYGRRDGDKDIAVVRTLATDEERIVDSPVHPLTNVDLDASGRHMWLSAYERELTGERVADENMCNMGGCSRGIMARATGHVVVDLRASEPAFVRLEKDPLYHRAVADAVLLESYRGIELVSATRQTRVAPAGCRVAFQDIDTDALIVGCDQGDDTHRYSVQQDGFLVPIAFETHGPEPASDGDPVIDEVGIVRGIEGTWLSLATGTVVQGLAAHAQGHAWNDRALLTGPGVGVEIRDARSGTTIATHDISGSMLRARGPFVVLMTHSLGRSDGWVIDLRDGAIVRTFAEPPIALSRSGHIATRDELGRIRWH